MARFDNRKALPCLVCVLAGPMVAAPTTSVAAGLEKGWLCSGVATSAAQPDARPAKWPDTAVATLTLTQDGTIQWSRSEISWSVAPTPWQPAIGAAFDYALLSADQWRPAHSFGVSVFGRQDRHAVIRADGRVIFDGHADAVPGMQVAHINFDRTDEGEVSKATVGIIDAAANAVVVEVELSTENGEPSRAYRFDTGAGGRREAVLRQAVSAALAAGRDPRGNSNGDRACSETMLVP